MRTGPLPDHIVAEVAAAALEDADAADIRAAGRCTQLKGGAILKAAKLNPMGVAYLPAGPPELHAYC